MPCDYKKYHPEWKTKIRPDILERDEHRCKFCGVPNHSIGVRHKNGVWEEVEKSFAGDMYAQDLKDMGLKVIKIVLTIAHLDHDKSNNDYSNLAALCQKCHLGLDLKHHMKNARDTRIKKKKLQTLF